MNSQIVSIDNEFTPDKIQLLKNTICPKSTDNELELFMYVCRKLGLDPFLKQIHPVKRWNSALKAESMTIQVGIDGYRLIAERTGKYAPGKSPDFEYKNEKVYSSTAYVKKFAGGTWHDISATAYYDEYVCTNKDGTPMAMWRKPHIMLAKCAEALALRKAFPGELSGTYTDEEMAQADNGKVKHVEEVVESHVEIEVLPVKTFEDTIPHGTDENKLQAYITATCNHYQCTVEDTKRKAIENPDQFWKWYGQWLSKN